MIGSNETPKCTDVPHPLTELTSESYGQIMPEPRLKPLLAALLDDENINLSDIALRISHALKVSISVIPVMGTLLFTDKIIKKRFN